MEEVDKRKLESLEWGTHLKVSPQDVQKTPSGSTNKVTEALKQNFPHEATCSMFCGGKKCKYCNPVNWKDDEQAIKGLYSHWVTDNIIAISRPITEYVEKFSILKQFQDAGIASLINLQLPGEHASCGNGVHDGEFSYKQQDFMDNRVFFYNFGWKDFGVAETLTSLLDMVKVMQFAVSEGKVAVHCHAGKGRTGVLIACFLVFNNRMTANEAVHYVRSRRPDSVQTGPQVKSVKEFEVFLTPYRLIFAISEKQAFSLRQYLMRQRGLLHGFQARKLKFLPKVVFVVMERFLQLAKKSELLHIPSKSNVQAELASAPTAIRGGRSLEESVDSESMIGNDIPDNAPRKHSVVNGVHGTGILTGDVSRVGDALSKNSDALSKAQKDAVEEYKRRLNEEDTAWSNLKEERDPEVLATIMWDWLDHLMEPVIRKQDLVIIFAHVENPQVALKKLENGVRCLITYVIECLVKLQPITEDVECNILQKLISMLTQTSVQPVLMSSVDLHASTSTLMEMNDDDKVKLFRFFYNLLEILETNMSDK